MEQVSIIKDALEFSAQQAKPQIVEVGRSTFALWPDKQVQELLPMERPARPDTLPLTSLDAMVMMIQTEGASYVEGMATKLYITIPDAETVMCFTNPDYSDEGFRRMLLYKAVAVDVPGWRDDTQFGFEEAQIALRTRFQHTEDATYCMALLSQISMGAKVTYSDNGIATSVVTQKGAAQIRPLVKLRPYRTFQEVEQPLSEFHIRIGERGIRFIESDGGMWKLAARQTVKTYLLEKLAPLVEAGSVFIAL